MKLKCLICSMWECPMWRKFCEKQDMALCEVFLRLHIPRLFLPVWFKHWIWKTIGVLSIYESWDTTLLFFVDVMYMHSATYLTALWRQSKNKFLTNRIFFLMVRELSQLWRILCIFNESTRQYHELQNLNLVFCRILNFHVSYLSFALIPSNLMQKISELRVIAIFFGEKSIPCRYVTIPTEIQFIEIEHTGSGIPSFWAAIFFQTFFAYYGSNKYSASRNLGKIGKPFTSFYAWKIFLFSFS